MSPRILSRPTRGTTLTLGIVRRLLGRRPVREVDAELQLHFEMLVEDYVGQGMTFDAARRAATELIGDVSEARSEAIAIDSRIQRRETILTVWHALAQDVTLAFRMFA